MGGWLGRIVVGITLCLISFIAYSSQIFIIWPWYGRELSVELLTLLVPFKCVDMDSIFGSAAYGPYLQFSGRDAAVELLAMRSHRPRPGTERLEARYAV